MHVVFTVLKFLHTLETQLKNLLHKYWQNSSLSFCTTYFMYLFTKSLLQWNHYRNHFSASHKTLCHDFLNILVIGINQFDLDLIYNVGFTVCYSSTKALKSYFHASAKWWAKEVSRYFAITRRFIIWLKQELINSSASGTFWSWSII